MCGRSALKLWGVSGGPLREPPDTPWPDFGTRANWEPGLTDEQGALLRRLRKRARLTQEQLAERSTVSVRTIRRLETGRSTDHRLRTLHLLADALGVGTEERRQLTDTLDRAPEDAVVGPPEPASSLPASEPPEPAPVAPAVGPPEPAPAAPPSAPASEPPEPAQAAPAPDPPESASAAPVVQLSHPVGRRARRRRRLAGP